MKKVLAIVLALAMILGSFSFVAAGSSTEYNDVAGTKYEGAVAVLGALDIVSGYPDGTFKPAKVVTRAEMCKLIITALGLDGYVAGSYAGYADVAGSHWATSYIAYATSLGVITGYPDGTFRPENPVTYQEAAAMLVRALGYQDQYLIGSWPASHVNVAMSAGILKGVTATAEGANRGDIATMIYNALTAEMVQYNSFGITNEAGTMLDRMGAFKDENVVINQEDVYWAQKNFGLDLSDYLGAYGDVYKLDVNKDGYDVTKGDGVIVLAKEKATLLTGTFKLNPAADKFDTLVVGDTEYKFNNLDIEALLNTKVYDEFVNGSNEGVVGTEIPGEEGEDSTYANYFFSGETVLANKGVYTFAVKLNGLYITEIYSIGQWKADAEVKWTASDAQDLADDDLIAAKKFKMTKTDAIDMGWVALEGVEDLAAIPEDAIVTVYTNLLGEVTKVGVSTDTVEGKITKVAGVPAVYTIGEAGYKQSAVDNANPALGVEGTFLLNHKGEIAFIKPASYAGNYAVVLKDAAPVSDYTADDYQIYLMTKDGEKTVYKFKDADTYAAQIANVVAGDLITFKTNADGKIIAITEIAGKGTAAESLTAKGIMNGFLVSDEVVVFDISALKDDPESEDPEVMIADTSKWGMKTLADLAVGNDFLDNGSVTFSLNEVDKKVDCIVISNGTNLKAATNMGFFTGKYDTYNAKNDPIYGGTILIGGAVVDYTTADQAGKAVDDTPASGISAAVVNRANLYTLTYKGADIHTVALANALTGKDAPQKESAFTVVSGGTTTKYDYTYYDVDGDADYTALGGDLGEFNLVSKKVDNTINLGTDSAADYQFIGAATSIYKVTIKANANNDGYVLDKLVIGSMNDVKKGAYVQLMQLDKTSGAWDTIIVLSADDYKALNPQQQGQ